MKYSGISFLKWNFLNNFFRTHTMSCGMNFFEIYLHDIYFEKSFPKYIKYILEKLLYE